MRSEKEIREKISVLEKFEKREAKTIKDMMKNNEMDFVDLHMDKANMLKQSICDLKWVLGEIY